MGAEPDLAAAPGSPVLTTKRQFEHVLRALLGGMRPGIQNDLVQLVSTWHRMELWPPRMAERLASAVSKRLTAGASSLVDTQEDEGG